MAAPSPSERDRTDRDEIDRLLQEPTFWENEAESLLSDARTPIVEITRTDGGHSWRVRLPSGTVLPYGPNSARPLDSVLEAKVAAKTALQEHKRELVLRLDTGSAKQENI